MEESETEMTSTIGTTHKRPDAEGMEKAAGTEAVRIAVISDTHNLLRPEVAELIKTCGCVLHAGDISDLPTLNALEMMAPVYAVRGNNDKGSWADRSAHHNGRAFYGGQRQPAGGAAGSAAIMRLSKMDRYSYKVILQNYKIYIM